MDLHIKWHKALFLKDADNSQPAMYSVKLERIPDCSGIYIFFRSYGKSKEALYIGKAKNLRRRIKQQLNNLRLMKSINNASKGYRMLVIGEFTSRGNRPLEPSLKRIESLLIRHYVEKNHNLLNNHGTGIRKHNIFSYRSELKSFIPHTITYTEKNYDPN
jgi:hypothetical protein